MTTVGDKPATLGERLAAGGPNLFDLLRLVGAALVTVGHGLVLAHRPDPLQQLGLWTTLHGLGLHIFFVVSGFLVAASYQRAAGLADFAAARALRILPALAVAVAVTAFAIGAIATAMPRGAYLLDAGTWSYLKAATGLSDYRPDSLPGVFLNSPAGPSVNASLWTIRIELLMYLLTPALFRAGRVSPWLPLVLAAALASAIRLAVERAGISGWWVPHLAELHASIEVASYFVAGAWLFAARATVRVDRRWIAAALALLAAGWITGQGRLVAPIALPYLIVAAGLAGGTAARRLTPPLDISYGLYLYSFPVQQLLAAPVAVAAGIPAYLVATFALVVPLAAASRIWIETPALRLRALLARRRPGPALPKRAAALAAAGAALSLAAMAVVGRVPTWTAEGRIELGRPVLFVAGTPLPLVKLGTWWQPEPWGTWTGDHAGLALALDQPPAAPLRLTLKALAFRGTIHRRQPVDLLADGVAIAHWDIDQPEPVDLTATLPPALFAPSGRVTLTLRVPTADSPSSVGTAEDTRVLGLGVLALILDHA